MSNDRPNFVPAETPGESNTIPAQPQTPVASGPAPSQPVQYPDTSTLPYAVTGEYAIPGAGARPAASAAPPVPKPAPAKGGRSVLVVIAAVIIVLGMAVLRVSLREATPAPKPAPVPTFTIPITPPTLPIARETGFPWPTEPVETPYEREVLELDELNQWFVGQLEKGDCALGSPESSWYGSDTLVAPVVDCDLPHQSQVAGFVDVSGNAGGVEGEISVAQRCNSLIRTLPPWDEIESGLMVHYPSAEDIVQGYTVAVCWVPIFDKTWTGSAVDGTGKIS
ncbi:MAG: hypothetical protein LBR58_05230 [Propionibacteriaceae bacterium]|jgi:hypothetical protein|nr:hypothetical protein [Propionibacteriaceae bacterium]